MPRAYGTQLKVIMCYLVPVLLFIPLGLAQVISPDEVVTLRGGRALFTCVADGTVDIRWLLDCVPLENLNLSNMTRLGVHRLNGETIGSLSFFDIPVHLHNTSVRCSVELMLQSDVSGPSMLLVQGLLSAVDSLNLTMQDTTLSLTWTAPFTLDIPFVDPDITYCVDVVNSTSSSTVYMECGITETEFSYTTPPDTACHIYTFTVTPVNVVGDGESNATSYLGADTSPKVQNVLRIYTLAEVFTYVLNMTAPVCDANITSIVDIYTNTKEILDDADLTIIVEDSTITVSSSRLTANRYYTLNVIASNVFDSAASFDTISTHDILEATANRSTTNEVVVDTNYFDPSNASGALYLFVPIRDDVMVDFTKSAMVALSRNMSQNRTLPFILPAGSYTVLVYDIKQDGMLSNGVSYYAIKHQLIITGNGQGPEFLPTAPDSCKIYISAKFIEAVCVHSSNSGFQMIVQSDALDQLYVSRTTDDHTSASVVVEESEQYLVSIIPIIEGTGITDSAVEYTEVVTDTIPRNNNSVIIATIIIATIIIIAVGLVCFIRNQCKKRLCEELPRKVTRKEVQVETDQEEGKNCVKLNGSKCRRGIKCLG